MPAQKTSGPPAATPRTSGPTLWVTEFPAVLTGAAPLAAYPSFGTQGILLGITDNVAILGPTTYLVRLFADADCFIDIGLNPLSHSPVSAGFPEFYSVQPGYRLAAKQR